ncbi:MAG TPA: hypothetical protein DIW46_12550, partial [Microbacterium sp.]|nr:hypothetical protein [Microbacterium sp.]
MGTRWCYTNPGRVRRTRTADASGVGVSAVIGLRVLRVPSPLARPFVTAVRRTDHIDAVLVEVKDAEGRSGWGEAAVSWRVTGESPQSVAAAVAGPLADIVIGRDANDPDLSAELATT